MESPKKSFSTIDDYIQRFPSDIQARLQALRRAIQDAVPEATEAISYQMPTFKLSGIVVSFGAFKDHIGLYPAPTGIAEFQKDCAPYVAGKGTLQFPNDKPIPFELVTRIVQFRARENLKKQENKRQK
jgi:uncharacterized protein YdhG (YjbR/CyaY superfamily)